MLNPLIPMGAITSPMTGAEIREMMEAYSEAGIQQYLFYARGGCSVEYMSEEWLDICECIVREAERLHMYIWLYDEYDCPSGTCAGTILRDYPEYACHGLRVKDGKCEHVIGASYTPMADLLNPECVSEFISRTYEKLYRRLSRWFGTVIRGIFTDEPSMGCMLRSTVDVHPYTPGLEDDYRARFGGDLFDGLAREDPDCLQNYYRLLGERFRLVYVDRLRDWCDCRGVLLTGHLLEEVMVRNATVTSGNLLHALRGFSLPGMDEIFDNIGFARGAEWITLGTALSARSKNGLLAELGAFGPCDQPLGRYLQMIRFAAMFGVDHYVMAVSGADARGSFVKSDWLHCTNYTQPHFSCFREFGRLAKQAACLAQKTVDTEIAVEYPASEAAREITQPQNTVDAKLKQLLVWLTRNQYQWIFVEKEEPTPKGALRVRYDTVPEEIACRIRPKSRITLPGGLLPDELLVRRYTDGTLCALDLRDGAPARILVDHGVSFALPPRGLYVNTEHAPGWNTVLEIKPRLQIRTDRPNTLRCVFGQQCLFYRFRVLDPLTVRLYLRCFCNDASVLLDGKPVCGAMPCPGLTWGLREQYLQTDELSLAPGEHVVSISKYPGPSEHYLPCVFVAGDFSSDGHTLSAPFDSADTGEALEDRLRGFAGMIRYEFEQSVPRDARFLRADGRELCMRLYADGVCMGTCIAEPFVFRLPEDLCGKNVRFTLEQYTTIGPVFGDRDEVLRDVDPQRVLYFYYPSVYVRCGIKSLAFVTPV